MNNSQILPIGSIVNGTTYKVEKVLGQGNFGITYLVSDTVLGRKYAMKEFFPQDIADRDASSSKSLMIPVNKSGLFENLLKKFKSEARAISDCNHPGVVKILHVLPIENTLSYVMEFVDGKTVKELYEGKKLDISSAAAIVKKISEPLAYLHERKIAHFDLNPNNVMIRKDGSAVLIDFGFAKRYDESGHQMSSIPLTGGTLGYIAPEQDGGVIKDFTPSPDIYALGGIFYFLLTGHSPESYQEYLQEEELLLSELPEAVHVFFRKAMALKWKERFTTVKEFLDEVDKLTNSFVAAKKEKSVKTMLTIEEMLGETGDKKIVDSPQKKTVAPQQSGSNSSASKKEVDVKRGMTLSDKDVLKYYPSAVKNMEHLFGDSPLIGYSKVSRNGKWNYKNEKGDFFCKDWFDELSYFISGWARVKNNNKFNYVNSHGEILLHSWVDAASVFECDHAMVLFNGKWLLLDLYGKTRQILIKTNGNWETNNPLCVESFLKNHIVLRRKLRYGKPYHDYVYYLVKKNGILIDEKGYDSFENFGKYIVLKFNSGAGYNVWDKDKESFVFPNNQEYIKPSYNGLLIIRNKTGKYRTYNLNYQTFGVGEYTDYHFYNDGLYLLKVSLKSGLIYKAYDIQADGKLKFNWLDTIVYNIFHEF